jgi:hypothetical protein
MTALIASGENHSGISPSRPRSTTIAPVTMALLAAVVRCSGPAVNLDRRRHALLISRGRSTRESSTASTCARGWLTCTSLSVAPPQYKDGITVPLAG